MTDNEIIKALECCLEGCNAEGCEDCPLYEKVEDCEIEIPIIALNLINRQKAEIEKLKTQLGKRENFFTIKLEKEQLNDIVKSQFEKFEVDAVALRDETIREFAVKLSSRVHKLDSYNCELPYGRQEQGYLVDDVLATIDNLVKEMTEDLQ